MKEIKTFKQLINEEKGEPLHIVWQDGMQNVDKGLQKLKDVYKQLGFKERLKQLVEIEKTMSSIQTHGWDYFNTDNNDDIISKN